VPVAMRDGRQRGRGITQGHEKPSVPKEALRLLLRYPPAEIKRYCPSARLMP
jgi:hypothetical protein